jgi:hypothetical protein
MPNNNNKIFVGDDAARLIGTFWCALTVAGHSGLTPEAAYKHAMEAAEKSMPEVWAQADMAPDLDEAPAAPAPAASVSIK